MSLLALPSEIFQQVLSETVSYKNFAKLRLVHSQFDDKIRASAEHLMKRLVRARNVSDHVLSLHQLADTAKEGAELGEQKLASLLRLQRDVATCVHLEEVLDTHREKFAAFPIWADIPAKGFGSIESMLVFSAFHRELLRIAEGQVDTKLSTMIARAEPSNDRFGWLKLDQHFMNFIRVKLTVDDLQALMTIVNFCAISTRFIDTILTSRYYFNDAGVSDHWQNEQLGSALLAERILWSGPSWLAKMLHQNTQPKTPAIRVQQHAGPVSDDDHTMWTGSRTEAARLTANGVARFLWRERAHKLELEHQVIEASGIETKPLRPEFRIDAAVWRGSSGGVRLLEDCFSSLGDVAFMRYRNLIAVEAKELHTPLKPACRSTRARRFNQVRERCMNSVRADGHDGTDKGVAAAVQRSTASAPDKANKYKALDSPSWLTAMPPTLISLDLFDAMSLPLSALSASKQNALKSPSKPQFKHSYTSNNNMTTTVTTDSMLPEVDTPTDEEFHDSFSVAPDNPESTFEAQDGTVVVRSPAKRPSPVKATLFGEDATASTPEEFEAGTVVVKSPVKRMSPVKTTLFDDAAPASPEAEAEAEDGTVVVRSPIKRMSPIKNTLFDVATAAEEQGRSSPRKRQASEEEPAMEREREHSSSPTNSPRPAMRFNEGLTMSMQQMQLQTQQEEDTSMQRSAEDELMSRIYNRSNKPSTPSIAEDETELTLNMDDKTNNDLTVGDLSTISAIPAGMTRFANLRSSPTKTTRQESWSPSKQLRNSVILNTPGTAQRGSQRPLHLLSASRHSNSSNEDEEATPRRPQSLSNDSPTDLLDFTGQSNIQIPPPGSAPRSSRRAPSGRGGFPIRVNPSPTHHSQASLDRQAAAGNISPQRSYFPPQVQATPAGQRKSQYGLDLLDIDLEPMATPRSIPTVTPRELETLRSELQSRISGLEATLSGKEAEVSALKRAITDAEVRVGKTSEELRNERAGKEDLEQKTTELEKRSREMEEVLREVKQNAFVEEREREKLRREKEEMEKRCDERAVKVLELTASLDTLRDQRIQSTPSPQKAHSRSPSKDQIMPQTPGGSIDIDTAVKNATENVARELHALYKGKHERKVADLKTSYEKRWQKQVQELRDQLKVSQDEVLALQTSRDATMSGVVPNAAQVAKLAELSKENDSLAAEKSILDAKVAGLEEQIVTVKVEAGFLRKNLEQERGEKGELVAQVDLFLSMSAEAEAAKKIPLPESPPRLSRQDSHDGTNGYAASPSKVNQSNRTSMNGGLGLLPKPARPMSMLKAPTKYSALPQPGNKTPARAAPRGGILENIARMGAGGR